VSLGAGGSDVNHAPAVDSPPPPVISLVNPGHSTLQCRVSNTCAGGVDNLDNRFDMASADQGTIADDPVKKSPGSCSATQPTRNVIAGGPLGSSTAWATPGTARTAATPWGI